MLYAKIKNNKVESLIERPNWFMDNGQPVGDDYLKNQNIYPVNMTEDASKNNMYFNISVNDLNDMTVDTVKKEVNNYYKYTPANMEVLLQKIYEEKKKDVDRNRDASIFQNFEYDFPSGKGVVQLRNDIDMRNIQVNSNEAMIDLINGNNDKIHIFLDADNVIREMTAKQMTEMGSFAKERAQNFYTISWNHKHNNLKVIYDDNSKSIQQKIDEIMSYDITTGFLLNSDMGGE